jgi:hypothetical protein
MPYRRTCKQHSALLARLATHVNPLDPIATACDVVGDIRSRA